MMVRPVVPIDETFVYLRPGIQRQGCRSAAAVTAVDWAWGAKETQEKH